MQSKKEIFLKDYLQSRIMDLTKPQQSTIPILTLTTQITLHQVKSQQATQIKQSNSCRHMTQRVLQKAQMHGAQIKTLNSLVKPGSQVSSKIMDPRPEVIVICSKVLIFLIKQKHKISNLTQKQKQQELFSHHHLDKIELFQLSKKKVKVCNLQILGIVLLLVMSPLNCQHQILKMNQKQLFGEESFRQSPKTLNLAQLSSFNLYSHILKTKKRIVKQYQACLQLKEKLLLLIQLPEEINLQKQRKTIQQKQPAEKQINNNKKIFQTLKILQLSETAPQEKQKLLSPLQQSNSQSQSRKNFKECLIRFLCYYYQKQRLIFNISITRKFLQQRSNNTQQQFSNHQAILIILITKAAKGMEDIQDMILLLKSRGRKRDRRHHTKGKKCTKRLHEKSIEPMFQYTLDLKYIIQI